MGVDIPTTKIRKMIGPYTIKKEANKKQETAGLNVCITDHIRSEFDAKNMELKGIGVQYNRQQKIFQNRTEGEFHGSFLDGFGKIFFLGNQFYEELVRGWANINTEYLIEDQGEGREVRELSAVR